MNESSSEATTPRYTMFFDQSAHLDWDWIRTFHQNYWYYSNGTGADAIISSGINAAADQTKYPGYSYSVCEMAFLRQFVNANPGAVKLMNDLAQKEHGERFQVVGAGITSPDCLVTSAEGFIRNYLVGQTWVKNALNINPKPYCWIPDDFGQGPELPTLLSALGFENVVIARTPDTSDQNSETFKDGFDIIWEASDGSTIALHWTGGLYNKSGPLQYMGSDLKPIKDLIDLYESEQSPSGSGPVVYSGARSNYMYWPIMDDFSTVETPIPDLGLAFSTWNNPPQVSEYSAKATNVKVQWGTFDQYHKEVIKFMPKLSKKPYNGTPLWTGFFASRPKLKTLHHQTVRALVAAEVFGLLTQPWNPDEVKSLLPADFWVRIDQVWLDFAPSTHHDFVTGTAPDDVYTTEQLPILVGTAAAANSLSAAALCALAGAVSTSQDNPQILVANSLGFARSGLSHIQNIEYFATSDTISWPDGSYSQTQRMSDGSMTVYVPQVRSFGYIVGEVSSSNDASTPSLPEQSQRVKLTMRRTQDAGSEISLKTFEDVYAHFGQAKSFTITNQSLEVTISEKCGWGIESIKDTISDKNILRSGAVGNDIYFYDESSKGDIYQFGNEKDSFHWTKRDVEIVTQGPGLGAIVAEIGELVTVIRTEIIYKFKPDEFQAAGVPAGNYIARKFTREYEMRAGEPFLRMSTTGSAPPETAVVAAFPFESQLGGIDHGTGYHWTDTQPYINPNKPPKETPVFRPTHDFLQPFTDTDANNDGEKTFVATFYHEAMPAWAIDRDAKYPDQNETVVMGCLYRNSTTRSNDLGAVGTDAALHTHRYAIRAKSGLEGPQTGQPYREAQGFHTSLQAVRLPRGPILPFPGMLRDNVASLAEVHPENSTAMLTVAKPGNYDKSRLILRLYQADNKAKDKSIQVTLPNEPTDVKMVTALETEWKQGGTATAKNGQKAIVVTPSGSVSTVSIAGLGRRA